MSDAPNVESTTVAAPEPLKSTDTSSLKAAAEPTKVTTETPTPEAIPDSAASEEAEANETPDDDEEEAENTDAKAADSPGKSKKLPKWVKERLERAERVAEKRTRDAVIRELQSVGAIPNQQQQHMQERENLTPAKTLADFDFDQDAYIDHKVQEGIRASREHENLVSQNRQAQQAQQDFSKRVTEFESRVGEGSWDEIVTAPINTPPAMIELIKETGHDLDVALYLARHVDEANEIAQMSTLKMARAIDDIAGKFGEVGEKSQAPKVQKKTTQAPAPAKTVVGSGNSAPDLSDPNISSADRIKAWSLAKSKGLKLK